MTDLIKEIQEDIKQDAFLKAIKKYSKYVVSISIIVVAIISVYVYFDYLNVQKQERISTKYHNMINSDIDVINQKVDSLDKNNIYSDLVKIRKANLLIKGEKSNHTDAVKLLLEVINQTKHLEIKNATKIRVAQLIMQRNIYDHKKMSLDLLEETKDNEPFVNIIRILSAQMLIESNSKNDQKKAKNILENVSKDNSAPQNIKFFAQTMMLSIN